jgi:hypothetical protein
MRIFKERYNKYNCRFDFKMLGGVFLYIVLILSSKACVEPYNAEIEEITPLISIEGGIIKGDSVQQIAISRTATLLNPQFTPVEGCKVKVLDEENNEFVFREMKPGVYSLPIVDESLVINRRYKLIIIAPDGNIYESHFENLNKSLDIDSVYFEIEERSTAYTEDILKGLQFYVDVKSADTISRYFRWKLTETYEYTSSTPIAYIYRKENVKIVKDVPQDPYEVFRCWKSEQVPGIFVSNTINLIINEKKKIPLNFVSNKSDRLKIKYSLLVNQYTMSEEAYKYWQQNKVAISESYGIYTKQPGKPVSNIVCTNDSLERVLGYFWVSSRTARRIFVPRINSLYVSDYPCEIFEYDPTKHILLPRYIAIDKRTGFEVTGHPECFDCTLRGGKITPPEFWN